MSAEISQLCHTL